MNRRLLAVSTLALVTVLAVSGCADFFRPAPAALSSDEIEGTWTAEEPAGGQSTVTFMDDGTVHLDTPVDLIFPTSSDPGSVDWARRLAGSGTWKIGATAHGTPQRVDFIIDDATTGPGGQAWFSVRGDVGDREIFQVLGDADSGESLVFEKQQ